MSTLHFELTTPERNLLKEEIDSITIPTQMGEITVLPGHIPLVATLATGMMTVRRTSGEEYIAVQGGFLEIQSGNKIIILADSADRAEEIDLEKVEAARERARQVLLEKRHIDDVSSAGATALLERELARIKVARHHRTKKGLQIRTE